MDLPLGFKIKSAAFFIVYELISFVAPAQELRLYTVNNELWNAKDSCIYFLIMKNNKNCISCFPELYQFLNDFNTEKKYKMGVVSQIDSSTFARKSEMAGVDKLMPNLDVKLFDYKKETEVIGLNADANPGSVFSKYKVDLTPALIVIKNGKMHYYAYNNIYAGKSINLNFAQELKEISMLGK